VFLLFVLSKHTQDFSTTLSFVERFELGPLSKECPHIRGSSRFEVGLRSLKSPFSGQLRLQDIRGRASVPRIAFFGPAAPSRYSRQSFGPSNCLFRASSAFKIFEAGLRSLELPFLGQQRLQDIRGRASVPRIVFLSQQRPQDV
jgi:hypothetical protein